MPLTQRSNPRTHYAVWPTTFLRENRQQAVRDYTKALELDPKAKLYGDRGLAEVELKEYQAAVADYTKAIAQGCEESLCVNYENRANL